MTAVAEPPVEIMANRVPVNVGGVVIYVGRLSMRQLLALGRIIPKVFASMPATQAKTLITAATTASKKASAKKSAKSNGATPSDGTDLDGADWAALIAVLDDALVGEVLGAILVKDADWCLDHTDLVSIGQIAEAILDHNEVDTLKSVFTKVGGSLDKLTPSSPPES